LEKAKEKASERVRRGGDEKAVKINLDEDSPLLKIEQTEAEEEAVVVQTEDKE